MSENNQNPRVNSGSINPQHSNYYYNLEFSATAEQLDLQRDAPDRELTDMALEGTKFLGADLLDAENCL